MHMSDALLSPSVAITSAAITVGFLSVAIVKLKKENNIAMMGAMGALIFAIQMINFTIPGTGSSGHIVGGILLAAILGPWAGFLTLSSVLVIQSLLFADGGLLALGCNILNLAVVSCLLVYPFIFKPLINNRYTSGRIMWVSLLSCFLSLDLGASLVTLYAVISGVTLLPFNYFLLGMVSIHLLISIGEGLATGAVLMLVYKTRPDLFYERRDVNVNRRRGYKQVLVFIFLLSLILGGAFNWIASDKPDGLEWSLERVSAAESSALAQSDIYGMAGLMQEKVSIMPDYNSSLSGIVGCIIIVLLALILGFIIKSRKQRYEK